MQVFCLAPAQVWCGIPPSAIGPPAVNRTKIHPWQEGSHRLSWWYSRWETHLLIQGTRAPSLAWEAPTCPRATKPVGHTYWAWAWYPWSHHYWACTPQPPKPVSLEPVLCNERSHCTQEAGARQRKSSPRLLPRLEKAWVLSGLTSLTTKTQCNRKINTFLKRRREPSVKMVTAEPWTNKGPRPSAVLAQDHHQALQPVQCGQEIKARDDLVHKGTSRFCRQNPLSEDRRSPGKEGYHPADHLDNSLFREV